MISYKHNNTETYFNPAWRQKLILKGGFVLDLLKRQSQAEKVMEDSVDRRRTLPDCRNHCVTD